MGEVGEVLHEPRYTQLPGEDLGQGVQRTWAACCRSGPLRFLGTELSPLRKQRRVLVVEHLDVARRPHRR